MVRMMGVLIVASLWSATCAVAGPKEGPMEARTVTRQALTALADAATPQEQFVALDRQLYEGLRALRNAMGAYDAARLLGHHISLSTTDLRLLFRAYEIQRSRRGVEGACDMIRHISGFADTVLKESRFTHEPQYVYTLEERVEFARLMLDWAATTLRAAEASGMADVEVVDPYIRGSHPTMVTVRSALLRFVRGELLNHMLLPTLGAHEVRRRGEERILMPHAGAALAAAALRPHLDLLALDQLASIVNEYTEGVWRGTSRTANNYPRRYARTWAPRAGELNALMKAVFDQYCVRGLILDPNGLPY